ncbi:MAG: sigma 54-interacting transcriptional regulator [Vicinamibacterales bacterium]
MCAACTEAPGRSCGVIVDAFTRTASTPARDDSPASRSRNATHYYRPLGGETGTGKELLARALHEGSPRRERPFVPFNCTAVAKDMLDAQLFGYRRGSFTGAQEAFPGVIRAAAGGTLFLDEIGEIGLDVQPKLLRFLESGEIHPLGEARPLPIDVRIVAATNANLDVLVSEGRFREDLFYRINVVRLAVPPLRERREEIPLLVEHFIEKYSQEARKAGLRLAEETMEYLALYKWPGNVRQLANELRRMVALAESGTIDEDLHERLKRELPAKGMSRFINDAVRARLRPSDDELDDAYRTASREVWRRSDTAMWDVTDVEDWPE